MVQKLVLPIKEELLLSEQEQRGMRLITVLLNVDHADKGENARFNSYFRFMSYIYQYLLSKLFCKKGEAYDKVLLALSTVKR